jgi:hypothetical protein
MIRDCGELRRHLVETRRNPRSRASGAEELLRESGALLVRGPADRVILTHQGCQFVFLRDAGQDSEVWRYVEGRDGKQAGPSRRPLHRLAHRRGRGHRGYRGPAARVAPDGGSANRPRQPTVSEVTVRTSLLGPSVVLELESGGLTPDLAILSTMSMPAVTVPITGYAPAGSVVSL